MDEKQNKLSVCSINPQNFSVGYGSHAVCVFMMSRCQAGTQVEY